jgi:hypothetical protein
MKTQRSKSRFEFRARRIGPGTTLWVILATLALGGCGGGAAESADPGPSEAQVATDTPGRLGAINLNLDLGTGIALKSATYEITGPAFEQSAPIDVSHGTTLSVVVPGVPLGAGYVATLNASTMDKMPVFCGGSQSFAVTSTGVTPVNIHVVCKHAAGAVPVPTTALIALSGLLLGLGVFALGRLSRRNFASEAV